MSCTSSESACHVHAPVYYTLNYSPNAHDSIPVSVKTDDYKTFFPISKCEVVEN